MPDDWERRHGLDAADPADGTPDVDRDGYTNLEEFLNQTDPRTSDRIELQFDFTAILAQLEALNAAARAAIAEERRQRPAGASLAGRPTPPLQPMPIQKFPNQPQSLGVRLKDQLWLGLNRVPAGKFLMGSPETEPERGQDEQPHWVTLTRPFYMGITPVTADEYRAVMGSEADARREGRHPAEVPWPEAVRFCETLSRNTGRTFRLPTEAEWEYACRAGTTTPFNTGLQITTDQANFDGKFVYPGGQAGEYRRSTTPVRTFPPNAWGLYDMHGNVYQWCSDWYGRYPTSAVTDPPGPSSGADRVIRGGRYGSAPRYIRSAARYSYNAKNSSVVFGFRVVMEVEDGVAP